MANLICIVTREAPQVGRERGSTASEVLTAMCFVGTNIISIYFYWIMSSISEILFDMLLCLEVSVAVTRWTPSKFALFLGEVFF